MTSKRVYLFLTAALLLISFGTGFAWQDNKYEARAALNSLQTAKLQLAKSTPSPEREQAELLVDQAIQRLSQEIASQG